MHDTLAGGICVDCHPHEHELADGICVDCQPLSVEERALVAALDELGQATEAWDPAKHPRGPDGRFLAMVDRLKDAIERHRRGEGGDHPFDGYSREQLRRVARARGITLGRGEDRDSIAGKLLEHLDNGHHTPATPALPAAPSTPRRPRAPSRATQRRRAAVEATRAATVSSLVTEQLWRERTDAGRRRVAGDVAAATWWRDDFAGAAETRSALRRYGRGDSSIEDLQRAGAALDARHNLRPQGIPGDHVQFHERSMEQSTNFAEDGIRAVEPGELVQVTAPGYIHDSDGTSLQLARTRVRPIPGQAAHPRPEPSQVSHPLGPTKLMLDSETEVPAAGTLFDRAAAAHPADDGWGGIVEADVDPRPFQQILGDEIAGLPVRRLEATYSTYGARQQLHVEGQIMSAGRPVGVFTVTFQRDEAGKISAYHDYLQLEPQYQGTGFANEYGLKLLTWYRESGFHEMTLHANIDVGGYAWARMGFNWANRGEADRIAGDLASGLAGGGSQLRWRLQGAPDLDEQITLGNELLERMRRASSLDTYPTPYEISQLGRWPGAGKDDMWIGKALLLGSSWHGTLTLAEVESR